MTTGYRSLTGAALSLATISTAPATEAGFTFFEKKIRPVLVESCYECHSAEAEKLKGGLRLDSKAGWQAGGDSGPAIVPGKPDESPLLQSIAWHKEFPEMPPKKRLPDQVVADFRDWIASGAPDPRIDEAPAPAPKPEIDIEQGRKFWSFQPRSKAAPPAVRNGEWQQSPIDQFIHTGLEEASLDPAPDTDPETLVRRLYFDLTGLPPTPEQIDAFVNSARRDRSAAIRESVDVLLDDPRFGEKWARHWLDLARYADSNGGDINLTFHNSWRYRNYVVDAFNSDKPYDQFIREQLAGDLLPFESAEQRAEQLVGTGFLIIGPKMLSERDKEKMHLDIADEQIDTVGRVFLGMTLGCARCHDHKFDPVPIEDYYALAGIFHSTKAGYGNRMGNVNVSGWIERDLPVEPDFKAEIAAYRKEKSEIEKQLEALKEQLEPLRKAAEMEDAKSVGILVDNPEAEITGTWKASTFSKNYIGDGYIHDDKLEKGKLAVTWKTKIPASGEYEVRVSYPGNGGRDNRVPYTVKHADGEESIIVDQTTKAPIGGLWEILGRFTFEAGSIAEVTLSNRNTTGYVIADAAQFIPVADLEKEKTESPARARFAEVDERRKTLEADLKKLNESAPKIPQAMAAQDREGDELGDLHVRVRGETRNLGEKVSRGFIRVIDRAGSRSPQIAEGESGRRELADWIASPENPLTARVIVNRIWQHLFGEGIVRSVDNFGVLGDQPSHPELLDWLADDFIAHGWSIKHTIRRVVSSRTWQLSTEWADGESDPENRLLGRQNRRPLPAESVRDAMLAVSGSLDIEPPESSVPHLGDQAISNSAKQGGSQQGDDRRKRSLYLPMVRNDMPPFLETFDMANPDMVTGRRAATTVPAQALLMMNSDFVRAIATETVKAIHDGDENATITALYRRILGRSPTAYEASNARAYVAELEAEESLNEDEALASFAQVLFASTEFRYLD